MAVSQLPALPDRPLADVERIGDVVDSEPLGPGMVRVTSILGEKYTVDTQQGRCTCPSHKYSGDEDGPGTRLCKHLLRQYVDQLTREVQS